MPSLLRDGDVYVLHLGDGENRFTPDWMLQVHDLLGTLRSDPAPLVTTATGKIWSNGLDLEWLQANPTEFQSYISDAQHLLAAFLELPVPTVAAGRFMNAVRSFPDGLRNRMTPDSSMSSVMGTTRNPRML